MVKYSTSEKAIKKSKRNLNGLIESYMNYLNLARTPSSTVKTKAGLFLCCVKSENGNGITTMSPFINLPMLYPLPLKANPLQGLFRMQG